MADDDDQDSARDADVRPLPAARPAVGAQTTRRRSVRTRRSLGDAPRSLAAPDDASTLESGDEVEFARPGTSRDVVRRLRRGYWAVQAEIDLHGLSRQAAQDALREFVAGSVTGAALRARDPRQGPPLRRGRTGDKAARRSLLRA